jgi:cobalt-zinc-cadmium resistance protein CzcA
MQGVEGQIFRPMAQTYGYALAGALFATFTVTLALSSVLLPQHVREVETILVRLLRPVLRWSLGHRKTMAMIGLVFLGVIGLMATRLGSEFLPHLEEGNLWIRVQLPPSTGLVSGTPATKKLREILLAIRKLSPLSPARSARRRQRCFTILSSRTTSGRQVAPRRS